MATEGYQIKILAGADLASSSATATGYSEHVITDKEEPTFHLTKKERKDAVKKYKGKKPDDAYLHGPTGGHSLYKKYGWEKVHVETYAVKAEILEIKSEPVIVSTKKFKNNSNVPATFDASISDEVSNSAESNWSHEQTIEVSQSINYSLEFGAGSAGGETSFTHSQTWGVGGSKSRTTTVGSQTGVSIELEPGQAVEARLMATRGVMRVRVSYVSRLRGKIAVNYNPPYQGHHFYGLDVNNVLKAAGHPTSVWTYQDIEIGYYTDDIVEVVDVNSKRTLMYGSRADAAAPIETVA